MQYTEALDYLYSRLPVFHRIGAKALKPGLGNTLALCQALGNPQHRFRSIHVAGTNGKGSTAHMLAAIYQSAGYRVGLYTSPHLKSFTERIRISGQPIEEEAVADFVRQHQPLIESIEPSFFEVTVAMAFDYFARQSVDLAIIEVGLGGRLDSTNVITPDLSLITNIAYDHTDILGDTLPQIAAEKAGIIKAGVPVLVGESHPETSPVFTRIAHERRAPIYFPDQYYQVADAGLANGKRLVRVYRGPEAAGVAQAATNWLNPVSRLPAPATAEGVYAYELDLPGIYQLRNLPAVLETVRVLQDRWPVPDEAIQAGLAQVTGLTGLKGRFQWVQEHPRVIADTAHNQAGLSALLETVNTLPYQTLRIILGLVADKDRSRILTTLPQRAVYYFCQADSPRSLSAVALRAEAALTGRIGAAFLTVNEALTAALAEAYPDDLILITGSNYTIAELTQL